MTQIELTHRIKEKAANARYIAATSEYQQQLDSALAEIEEMAQELINLREQS